MFSKYLWLSLLLGIVYFLYSRDFIRKMKIHLTDGTLSIVDAIYLGLNENSEEQRVFTTSELKRYTNLENGLYLSILGQVFDVTKREKHYGPGNQYHAFTGNYFLICWKTCILATICIWNYSFIGRDASLAFITGEFERDLTDDISSLSAQQVKALDDWLQFYNTNYIYKGTIT